MAQKFFDFLLPKNVLPCISGIPTRITETTATQIDFMCVFRPTSKLCNFIESGSLLLDISDHLPVFFIMKQNMQNMSKKYRGSRRSYSDRNIAAFRNDLSQQNWDGIMNSNDCNIAFDGFHKKFMESYDKCFPKKTISRTMCNKKNWVTKGLLICIKHKNRLYRKHLKNRGNISLHIKYKTYKNKLNNVLKKAEKDYYVKQLMLDKHNVSNIWRVYSEILGKHKNKQADVAKLVLGEKTYCDSKNIAESFNQYFAHIGSELAKGFPRNEMFKNYLGNSCNQSMFLSDITRVELQNHLALLDKNKSAGYDEVTPRIISVVSDIITQPLLHLYNLSFRTGTFPDVLKIAKIIPLYKKKEHFLPGNYRPISLLSIFSKILEKLMQQRLYSYLSNFNILFKLQFGFREHHSTTLALTEIVDSIRKEVDNGNSVLGIYLDLSKAFDTVCHDKLLFKLNHYGIRGSVHDWLRSYLSGRSQTTYVNKTLSSIRPSASVGVPQGSALSPLLFLCYVNDIANVLENNQLRLFADDTNVFISGPDVTMLQEKAQTSLLLLDKWFTANELTLNISKTCVSLFSKKHNSAQIELNLNGTAIPCVNSTRYLGVYLDANLNFIEHCNFVKNKLTKLTSACYYISNFITKAHVRSIYFAYLFPHINYGIEIVGVSSKKNRNLLQGSQNKLLKVLCKSGTYDSPQLLHEELGIFNISQLTYFHTACFVYKQLNGLLPSIFEDYFKTNEQMANRSHRRQHKLYVPFYRLEFGQRAFPCIAAKIWNSLPQNITTCDSLNSFKHNLKQSILEGTIETNQLL